jgi:tetratricopeptide (TPR) repeat protein
MRAKVLTVCNLLSTMVVLVLASSLTASSQQQAAPAATPQAKSEDAQELVKQGEKLGTEGKTDEALALYQRAAELDPNYYLAQLYMGVTLDLQGKYEEARRHLAKAIEFASQQQTVQALRVMAVSYAFERNTAKVAEYEQRAFDLQDKWKQYADAAGTADELARIYLEFGEYDKAWQWYQTGHLTAMKIPDLTPAQKDLWQFRLEAAQARIAARRGQIEAAKQHLAACKTLIDKANNPDQAQFYPYLAGYVALYSGDYGAAIKNLQLSFQNDPFLLSLLAEAYDKLGDKAHARDCYERIMKIYTHNPSNAFARPIARAKLAEQPQTAAPQGQ